MMDPGMLSLLNVTEADIMKDLPSKNRVVVLDIGSSMVKAGFSGETKPSCVFPTSTAIQGGYVEESSLPCLMQTDDHTLLSEKDVVSTGFSNEKELDDPTLEAIVGFTMYNQLGIRTNEYSTLVTQSFLNHCRNKEKMAQLLFEKFLCPSCFMVPNNELSMYSSGRITGICMEIGASESHCVPMRDGFAMPGFRTRSDVSGNDLTERMNQLLKSLGYPNLQRHVVEDIKIRKCQVATNLFTALSEAEEESYCLPNGKEIQIGKERFQCPEMLFNPIISFSASSNIYRPICEAIENIEFVFGKALADKMYNNIVLSGGTANFMHLGDRMTTEINKCKKRDAAVKVIVVEDGLLSAFRGGSILSSLPTYAPIVITRDEYLERGMNAVYQKIS